VEAENMTLSVLAVDVGATKVAVALVDENYSIREKYEISVLNNSNLWDELADVSTKLLKTADGGLLGVGIGSAGPIQQKDGLVSPVNIKVWRGFPIVEKFASLTNNSNVVLHGDAMAMVHAEWRLGAGIGTSNLLGIVVSTGIGGGLILENNLHMGESGNSFFLGHQAINFDGIECTCGRIGCLEAYASGPRMVAMAAERGWKNTDGRFEALAESARDGDGLALEIIDQGARALAIGIVNSVASLDLKTVVVGGGVAQSGEIYWEPLRRHIKNEAQYANFLEDIDLRAAKLQRDAGILGAALGVFDQNISSENFQNSPLTQEENRGLRKV
jgi:glucokinase